MEYILRSYFCGNRYLMKAVLLSAILILQISFEAMSQVMMPDERVYSKWTVYITREVDLSLPANKGLDSAFNEYGKTMMLTQMLFDRVTAGRADAYIRIGRTDSFKKLEYDTAREIIDSLHTVEFEKIFLQEQFLFDSVNNRLVVRIMKLSPAIKTDSNRYEPTIWVPYPILRYYLSRQYIVDTKGRRHDLNDYFEGRYFVGKIISSYKPHIR